MQGGNDMSEGMMSTEIIMVPNKMVGLIIGRGGEQITRWLSNLSVEMKNIIKEVFYQAIIDSNKNRLQETFNFDANYSRQIVVLAGFQPVNFSNTKSSQELPYANFVYVADI